MRTVFSRLVIVLALAVIAVPSTGFACVTKSGKDCSATTSKKAAYQKKLFVVAPAGGVGGTASVGGVDPLGLPSANMAAAPAPASSPSYGTNPDGWFYLIPSSATASGLASKPMPYRVAKVISDHRPSPLLNPDGSLTANAVGIGWVRLQAPAPGLLPQQVQQAPLPVQIQPGLQPQAVQAPQQTPGTTPALNPQATPGLQPQTTPTPNQVPQQAQQAPPQLLSLVPTPNLLPGHAAAGPDRAHPDRRVDVYHPTRAGVYRYEDAHRIGDPAFHLVVIGFKDPE